MPFTFSVVISDCISQFRCGRRKKLNFHERSLLINLVEDIFGRNGFYFTFFQGINAAFNFIGPQGINGITVREFKFHFPADFSTLNTSASVPRISVPFSLITS